MQISWRTLLVLQLIMLTATASAGEIRLRNGAILPGELQRIEVSRLIWNADLIGQLSIEKSDVLSLRSDAGIALHDADGATRTACLLQMDGGDVQARCAEGALEQPLSTLRQAATTREGTGKITAALSMKRNANDTDELDIDARTTWRRGRFRYELEASRDYDERNGITTDDEAELLWQADRLLGNDWYAFSMLRYYRDWNSSIQETAALVVGMGHEFHPLPDLDLALQAGVGEVGFNLDQSGKQIENAGSIRWRSDWKLPWRSMALFHQGEFSWVLDDDAINRLETRSGLSLPLLSGILAELRLDYQRYGIDFEGQKDDLEWVFSLGYRW